ncbi:PPE domain-containing protein [Actinocrispum wychmicini]|uniref:PPE family protein n=1 Tax=Actinocrispum wychmicini TaxID=1213861 RepID=A0A4R2K045_9PSEU|nr:PPE domain-containing protein [Actinocrispum wychmicini]TCO65007.1 PPE family protein [Actinocrispum wychmicini]
MGDIRWKGLNHETIHKMINEGPGPSASGPFAEFYGKLSEGLANISKDLHGKLTTLKVNWEGASGDAAQAGMSPLKDWADTAQTGANVMKISYEEQGTFVGQARAEVPKPVKVTTPSPSGWDIAAAAAGVVMGNPGPAAAVAAQAADHEGQERAQDEAARKAVDAMNKYQDSSKFNAETLGRFEAPPQVVVSTPPPIPGYHSEPVDTGGLHKSSTFSHSTTDPNHYTPPTSHIPGPPPPTHVPGPTPPPGTPPQHVPTPPPPGTTPSQHFPTPTPTPTPEPLPRPPYPNPTPGPGFPPGEGPFVPGQGGWNAGGQSGNTYGNGGLNETGGRGGTGGPGGQGGRGGVGGQGNFGGADAEGRQMGRGGAGAGANPFAQEGVGRGGGMGGNAAGGRGGAGGQMGAGGGRGQGEDDEEHETPSYLVETEDVFGDDRMVAPPVIGERPEQ